jgi:hypothetical protein
VCKRAKEFNAQREEVTEMRGLNSNELFWGFLLILVGGLLLLEALGVFVMWDVVIPIVLVLIGLFVVFRAFTSSEQQTPRHTPPRPHA